MAIIHTQRNSVHVEEPEVEDVFLQVSLLGPSEDGKFRRPVKLGWFPIADFQEWLDWAVAIADRMAHPIYILPLSHRDIFNTGRFDPYRKLLENLTDQEWEHVRRFIVAACLDVMRVSPDYAVRNVAYDQLVMLDIAQR